MQVVRTIVWVLLVVALALFSFANWVPVTLRLWDGVLIDTMLPALVITAFALGFVPMWLIHRAAKWQLRRRITALESAARVPQITPNTPVTTAPAATSPATTSPATTSPIVTTPPPTDPARDATPPTDPAPIKPEDPAA